MSPKLIAPLANGIATQMGGTFAKSFDYSVFNAGGSWRLEISQWRIPLLLVGLSGLSGRVGGKRAFCGIVVGWNANTAKPPPPPPPPEMLNC